MRETCYKREGDDHHTIVQLFFNLPTLGSIDPRVLQAAIALIVKGGADPHLPDLSAARHTPLEAAVVSGYRALSHRLVDVVNKRQKAEEKRHELLESFGVALREVR